MKKLLFLILFGFSFAYAMDERVIDFYFGNGVLNAEKDAGNSKDALHRFISKNVQMDVPYSVGLSYNYSYGLVYDLAETYYQLKQEGQAPDNFFTTLLSLISGRYGQAASLMAEIIALHSELLEDENLDEMVQTYQSSISGGHKVVLVSHSQGNLFGVRAYDKLRSWQKRYFAQVSVATPAGRVAGGGQYVTLRDDEIIKAVLGSLSGNAKNSEKVGFLNHGFVESYLNGDMTSGMIRGFISAAVSKSKAAPSQWMYEENQTCAIDGCANKTREVTHRYDDSLNEGMKGTKVYPFDESGKLYPVKSGYVKAEDIRGESVEEQESNVCYILKDTVNASIAEITKDKPCPVCEGTQSTRGIVEVAVLWGNKNADIDLNVEFPNGENDKNEQVCMFEHFYSNSEAGVTKGASYPVYVTYSELAEVKNKYVNDIYVTIKVPNKMETRMTNYAELDYLDGHVADIKAVDVNYTSREYNGTFLCDCWSGGIRYGYNYGNGSGWGRSGYSGGQARQTSNPYYGRTHYLYDIIWYISKGILGPLSGADVRIYETKDYDFTLNSGVNPVFVSKTTEGDTLLSAGNIPVPQGLDGDKLYVVEVKGGLDIDADDDANVDDTPTVNNGALRLVMSGYELGSLGFKVNVLTEVIYQLAKGSIDENNQTDFIKKSDEAAKCLLKTDINIDGYIDTMDAVMWAPFYGKDELLNHNYSLYYEPIINKIHNNQNIADNIAAMTKNPIFTNDKLYFFSNTTAGSNLGKAPYVCGFGFDKYSVKGEFATYFDIDGSGNITLKTSPPESKEYLTDIEMSNGNNEKINGVVNIVMIDENAPFLVKNRFNNAIPDIIEDGFNLGQAVIVHEGKGPIKNIRLEGDGADNFDIDRSGHIYVSARSRIDREDIAYRLKVVASNAYGAGIPVEIIIYVYTEYELVPIVTDTSIGMYGTEIETNKVIGRMKAAENIFCPISGFQTNSNVFGIKPNGDIYIKSYPSSNNYTIKVYAQSRCGNSNQANLSIDKLNRLIGEADVSNAKRITLSSDNTKMFIAGGKDGVSIMDITNPNVPSLTGLISTDDAHDAVAYNTKVYAADGANGVKIFDLSDNPTLIKSLPGINAQKISISRDGSQIYAVDKNAGLKIIDVSVPSAARIIGSIDSYTFYDVVQHPNNDNLLLTAGGFGGVKIYDITDTANPVLVGAAETTYARHITALDDLAYIADGSGGVRIIDISDTSAPKIIGTAHAANAFYAAVSDNGMQIYAAGGENGLFIIDARDISNPFVVNSINIIDAYSITLLDDMSKAYVIDSRGRIFIVAL
jgi:hypothetical protein